MAYYQRLRDLREDCDATQQEIAEYLGTSAQHYGKYELGNAEIPFERAISLARYYNVSLDYIAGLTNNKKSLSNSEADERVQKLLRNVEQINNSSKQAIIPLLKNLIEVMEN